MTLESILIWYQQKIGLYDKQSWETTVEQRILRGLSYSPRKTAKPKPDLIDVDLVRGSTFPKAKPQSDVWLAGLHGIIRILLLPFYCRWWIKEITYVGFTLVVSMYCSVSAACLIYFTFYESKEFKVIPGSEVLIPFSLLILLSIILSQMASTRRKGIKVTFGGGNRMTRTLRNGRKARSSRRNSLSATLGLSDFGKSCDSTEDDSRNSCDHKENFKDVRVFDSTYRSHSEDLYSSHILEVGNRSASENNLSFNYEKENAKNEFGDPRTPWGKEECYFPSRDVAAAARNSFGGGVSSYRTTSPNREDVRVFKSNNDCNLKYKGFSSSTNSNKFKREVSSRQDLSRDRFGGLPSSSAFERSSDGCSDGEEGCHADCESPTTDEDELSKRDKKSGLKKLDPGLLPLLPNSSHHQKLPFVAVSNDASNSSCDSDGEKGSALHRSTFINQKPMFSDWVGITNNEDPSYSSESEAAWDELGDTNPREPIDWHIQGAPAAVISSTTKDVDKVSCKIWEDSEMKKVDLSVLDIASAIISRVDSLRQSCTYLIFGLIMGSILSLVPSLYRHLVFQGETPVEEKGENCTIDRNDHLRTHLITELFGPTTWCLSLIALNALNRLVLGSCFFFLLSVAERTFKQRFLYAKHFSYLTSARRARKYDLPHFRLNKVMNIKAWLSIRSCLKKRGPQHSVDVIISATFIVTLLLVSYLGVEALKDEEKTIQPLHNCELFVWCFAVSIFLIRFMTLGALINKKYSNPSVLITEQINMYLHMEQNPQKKDNLMLANNVLKLVSVLLKELDSPFKISGLSANTLLYNVTKFGILSACSAVLSNLLGFKLKLHNIKFR